MRNNKGQSEITLTLWVIGIIALIGLFLLFKPFKIVDPGDRGVVVRMGSIIGKMDEGIHWKAPLVDSVKIVNVQIQKEETEAAAASKDLQQVTSKVAVNFNVNPEMVVDLYQKVGMDYKARLIDPSVQESIKAVTAKFTAEELITKRSDVSTEIKNLLNAKLQPYFRIDAFNILNFDFSKEFNAAIEAKQTAQQLTLKAEQDLNRVKVEAEQKVATAEAEAAALRAQRDQITPELLELRKIEAQIKAIDKWNGQMSTYYGGNGTMFNIPIGK